MRSGEDAWTDEALNVAPIIPQPLCYIETNYSPVFRFCRSPYFLLVSLSKQKEHALAHKARLGLTLWTGWMDADLNVPPLTPQPLSCVKTISIPVSALCL